MSRTKKALCYIQEPLISFGRGFKEKKNTVKLGFKELLTKEQLGNSEPFPMTNMPAHLINSEQIGFSEQFCDNQKVPYYQVWLYKTLGQILLASTKVAEMYKDPQLTYFT